MKARGLPALLAALLFAMAAIAADAAMERMAGRWYGHVNEGPFNYQWLGDYRADGTLSIHYLNCQTGLDSLEAGFWHGTESLFTNQTEVVGAEDGNPLVVSYLIEEQRADYIRYRDVGIGIVFEARRVGADFDLPGCDLNS